MTSLDEYLRIWDDMDPKMLVGIIAQAQRTVECAVCSEIMHVPFLASCGHSFCYGCLCSWFTNKVNCPTCRQNLEHPPILNVQLQEISHSISDGLIALGKDAATIKDQRDEATASYKHDSTRKKLFGDAFESALTLIDRSDGVPRCGNCHWEAHGSRCLFCGAQFRVPRDDDYFDSDDGDAYNEDDEEIVIHGQDEDLDGPNEYDTEDSFLDARELSDINNDLRSDSDEWHGFESGEEDPGSDRGDLERALDQFHNSNFDDYDDESHENDSEDTDELIRIIELQKLYQSSDKRLWLRGKHSKFVVFPFYALFTVSTVFPLYYTGRAILGIKDE
ncbi:hypothetical protein QFC19_009321 [Naganishia cerealis]|uniref:Uncharacterized protein n=1 Tax=Naganishia cerealis TaxID=610337 RepID=A0ACC2UWC9_9TREE|nr:hypothetical protein QFC19_009321 [Naganishia cerealis]